MSKPFTDFERKQIVAEYIETQNYTAVARKFGCSVNGVKKVVQTDTECAQKCIEKKEENQKEILEHMDAKKDKVCEIIDTYLEALLDKERIDRATPSQLSTALGTVIDKFLMPKDRKETEKENGGGIIILPEVKKNE